VQRGREAPGPGGEGGRGGGGGQAAEGGENHTARMPASRQICILSDNFAENSPESVREQFVAASSITALQYVYVCACGCLQA